MKIATTLSGLLLWGFAGSPVLAVTCDDVASVDLTEDGSGAFSLITGCDEITAETVSARWDELAPLAQAYFSSYLLIPGSSFPNDDQKLIDMVGNGETLLQRFIAMRWKDFSAEWAVK